jgi:RNA polymerase sigma factor (sigma-70 family)
MERQDEITSDDALLRSYLSATDAAETERLLERLLVERAAPLVRAVVGAKLHPSNYGGADEGGEAEDLHSEVLTQLLGRLRRARADPHRLAINDFRGYVAVIAYNVYYAYLRRKYPERRRLKNRIRYLLDNTEDFTIWEGGEQTWLCGLAGWRRDDRAATRAEALDEIRAAPESLAAAGLPHGDVRRAALPELLRAIFRHLRGAVELDALVNAVADLQGVQEHRLCHETDEHEESHLTERLADLRVDVATEVEQRLYLRRLWKEVLALPPRQRAALLLNFKVGQESILPLFPLLGIATIRQLAGAVGVAAEQFADLWKDLPLPDNVIASYFNLTRQQVINLRKSARERLQRRMKMLDAQR